ncbi:MAG: peroxiredoxin [Cytophagales bacterium]|nr:peroxiredoxin [Bernardetiaceae bacterium]MDW8203432.1 peroxiredoxin [Cytophagales bacterium]
MALALYSQAPDFTLPSTSGKDFQLRRDMAGKPCILYFYPKDFTNVCTAEACSFRDHFEAFRNLEVAVLGISRDSLATHQQFKSRYQLPFELLADTDGKVAKLYRAVIPIIGMPKRLTYLLDAAHRIVAVHEAMLESSAHVRAMLQALHGN